MLHASVVNRPERQKRIVGITGDITDNKVRADRAGCVEEQHERETEQDQQPFNAAPSSGYRPRPSEDDTHFHRRGRDVCSQA